MFDLVPILYLHNYKYCSICPCVRYQGLKSLNGEAEIVKQTGDLEEPIKTS